MTKLYFIAMGCFFAAAFFHAVLCRTGWRVNSLIKFLFSGCVMGLVLLFFALVEEALLVEKVAVILSYALVCELYVFLFTMVMGSMAVFSILQLYEGELSLEELEKRVGRGNAAEGRMENMRRIGLMAGNELTFKGKILASCFERLRSFFFPRSC